MAEALVHRGPDGSGLWKDDANQIILVHRRLAVLDLSPAGSQPMLSRNQRWVVVCNGEIYNHRELRGRLSTGDWRGTGDTETLVQCLEEWGWEKTLKCLDGMFALGAWDQTEKRLHLARDKFGEKPLYVLHDSHRQRLAFASELKALIPLRSHCPELFQTDPAALADFFRFGAVPAPASIFTGVRKIPPGGWMTWSRGEGCREGKYWEVLEEANRASKNRFPGTQGEAEAELDRALTEAVRSRCLSDVPLGAFLSGGIDSTLIAALLREVTPRQALTFTVRFQERTHDESIHAEAVARHLGTQHHTLTVDAGEAERCIPELPEIYDEPFADSSQIPTLLLCRKTRGHVTVALSGDGGDELFGGYHRHVWGEGLARWILRTPGFLRRAVRGPLQTWSSRAGEPPAQRLLEAFFVHPQNLLGKTAGLLAASDEEDFFCRLNAIWPTPPLANPAAAPPNLLPRGQSGGLTENMMTGDTAFYLPNDILVKVDRAAMSVNLETRMPFLDPRVARLAWSLPVSWKIRHGAGKIPLRKLLQKRLPKKLWARPKQGFAVPLAAWLTGPLRDWSESLLARLRPGHARIDPQPILAAWKSLLEGRDGECHRVWCALMFLAWEERWMRDGAQP